MLHYNPRHVSISTMFIFRRSSYIITAPGIVIHSPKIRGITNLFKNTNIGIAFEATARL